MPLSAEAALDKDRRSGLCEMQHRHFAAIATIIRQANCVSDRIEMAEHFATSLPETNPRFDRKRFLDAAIGQ